MYHVISFGRKEQSHQDLHYLSSGSVNDIPFVIMHMSTFKDGRDYFKNLRVKWSTND